MKYSLFIEEVDEIERLIKLNRKVLCTLRAEETVLFKKSMHKNITIEIYTFWENFVKKLIYHCYSNYKKILVDKKFLIKFFQHVNEKPYVRQLFLQSIDENRLNITKENLCHSNNLTFKELNNLFKRMTFDTNEFKKHVQNYSKLDQAIIELKNNSIDPVFEEIKSRYDSFEYLQAYLDLFVDNRNTVAHQYEITQIYSLDQFECILNFVKITTEIVFEFCVSQLLKKGRIKKQKVCNILYPVRVIKGNSSENAIIWIRNSSKKVINKNEKIYCLDRKNDIYRIANIISIRNKTREECNEILPLEDYSVEIETEASLNNRNNKFITCGLKSECEEYDYNVVV